MLECTYSAKQSYSAAPVDVISMPKRCHHCNVLLCQACLSSYHPTFHNANGLYYAWSLPHVIKQSRACYLHGHSYVMPINYPT